VIITSALTSVNVKWLCSLTAGCNDNNNNNNNETLTTEKEKKKEIQLNGIIKIKN